MARDARKADPPGGILSGRHAQGTADKLAKALLECPWQAVRQGVESAPAAGKELYVFAESPARLHKARHAPNASQVAMGAAQPRPAHPKV